jgi:hypothetical protein
MSFTLEQSDARAFFGTNLLIFPLLIGRFRSDQSSYDLSVVNISLYLPRARDRRTHQILERISHNWALVVLPVVDSTVLNYCQPVIRTWLCMLIDRNRVFPGRSSLSSICIPASVERLREFCWSDGLSLVTATFRSVSRLWPAESQAFHSYRKLSSVPGNPGHGNASLSFYDQIRTFRNRHRVIFIFMVFIFLTCRMYG